MMKQTNRQSLMLGSIAFMLTLGILLSTAQAQPRAVRKPVLNPCISSRGLVSLGKGLLLLLVA